MLCVICYIVSSDQLLLMTIASGSWQGCSTSGRENAFTGGKHNKLQMLQYGAVNTVQGPFAFMDQYVKDKHQT